MRIILTAFNDLLKSEPMIWPLESPPSIHIPIYESVRTYVDFRGDRIYEPKMLVAEFEYRGEVTLDTGHHKEVFRKYTLKWPKEAK